MSILLIITRSLKSVETGFRHLKKIPFKMLDHKKFHYMARIHILVIGMSSANKCFEYFGQLEDNNRLLTEREGRTGEYWPEVVAVRTERSEVRTATTEGQYSPVRPEQARLVSGLLYGTLFLIVKCNGTLFLIVKCNFKNAL